jgi:hypothetical protein
MTMLSQRTALAVIGRLSANPIPLRPLCACFPGTCRGGQVIDGRLATGQWCRAQVQAGRAGS